MVKPKETPQRVQTIHWQNLRDTLNTGHRKWRSRDPRAGDPRTGELKIQSLGGLLHLVVVTKIM